MVNYENGKIYTIRSYKTDLVYVGSTTQPLSKRMYDHKLNYNKWLKNSKNYTSSVEIFKLDDEPYIELVKNYSCNCKDELHKEEGKYIRKLKCVNKYIAGRSSKERYEENKEIRKENMKEYYKDNKEKMKEYYKEYNEKNKEMLKIKNKEYYEKHKKVMLEKATQKVKCSHCNKELTKSNLTRHIKNLH